MAVVIVDQLPPLGRPVEEASWWWAGRLSQWRRGDPPTPGWAQVSIAWSKGWLYPNLWVANAQAFEEVCQALAYLLKPDKEVFLTRFPTGRRFPWQW